MFNKETEYALRSLVYIKARNDSSERPGVTEIAREIDAPHFFTAKILQRLVKQGFIRSAKGKGGGFYFEGGKEDPRLRDIIIATEGPGIFTGCGFGLRECSDINPCPLHEQYAPIRKALEQLVSESTIADLARKLLNIKDAAENIR